MKYMILMKATTDTEAGRIPSAEEMQSMIAFNEKLGNDGILVATEGLRPSSKGTRVRFDGGRATVIDGPFAETKELIAGFWIVEGQSREEVVERFTHAPFERGQVIEVREFIQMEDFAEVFSPEMREVAERITLPGAS